MTEYRKRDRKAQAKRKACKRAPGVRKCNKAYRNGPVFQERLEALRRLGFADYHAYLQSTFWYAIRRLVMDAYEGKCVACCRKAEQIHHLRYTFAVMNGDDLKGMVPLCEADHMFIEWKCGRKVSLREANMRLTGLLLKRRM